jgi:hypothetical protein
MQLKQPHSLIKNRHITSIPITRSTPTYPFHPNSSSEKSIQNSSHLVLHLNPNPSQADVQFQIHSIFKLARKYIRQHRQHPRIHTSSYNTCITACCMHTEMGGYAHHPIRQHGASLACPAFPIPALIEHRRKANPSFRGIDVGCRESSRVCY